MSENVLETIRATVQDFLGPEIRTYGVRLDNIERRIDETKQSLEHTGLMTPKKPCVPKCGLSMQRWMPG